MKRAALALVLLGLVVVPTADALLQGGYDEATRELEAGFKIIATERIASDTECYPAPTETASVLRRELKTQVVVAPKLDSVQGSGVVNVIRDQTQCNRLVLAIRAASTGKVFILDSDYGPVYAADAGGLSQESLAGGVGPLRSLTAATAPIRMRQPDANSRFVVGCPSGSFPIGGGMYNARPIATDGRGIYSHSYERLGVQAGFHVTTTYVDPTPADAPPLRGGLQVLCGDGLVPTESPHETTFVRRHETGIATARCPSGTQLFSGGFQRTNFTTPGVSHGGIYYGGDYITESRAVGTNAWRVSGAAVDSGGGELTAIAYCAKADPSLPLATVSADNDVGNGEVGTVTTPRCPPGRALTAGGFSFNGSRDALFAEGYFTRGATWAATGYGWFGSAKLTAYGYCLKARDIVDRGEFPGARPLTHASDVGEGGSSNLPVYLGIAAVAIALGALGAWLRNRAA